jgi:hypothetical protein
MDPVLSFALQSYYGSTTKVSAKTSSSWNAATSSSTSPLESTAPAFDISGDDLAKIPQQAAQASVL